MALKSVEDFGKIAVLSLNVKKTKDFYNLLKVKIQTEDQTGLKRWSENSL